MVHNNWMVSGAAKTYRFKVRSADTNAFIVCGFGLPADIL